MSTAAQVVASLASLSLLQACLPSQLDVYRQVQDTYKSLDTLLQLLLEETVGWANMKTVVRPRPAVPCSPELLEALQDSLAAAGGCNQVC